MRGVRLSCRRLLRGLRNRSAPRNHSSRQNGGCHISNLFHRIVPFIVSSHKETCRLVGPLTTLLLSMFAKDRANTCAGRAADKCTLSSAEDRAQNSATRAADQRSLARPDTVVVPVARITVVVAIAVIAAIVFGVAAIVVVATIVSASATLVRAAV